MSGIFIPIFKKGVDKLTVVTIGENSIEITGHSPKQIVCHGVSAIGNMVANYVIDNQWGRVIARDGYLRIYDIKEQYMENPLFVAMVNGLKDIQAEYPNNIEIKYQ